MNVEIYSAKVEQIKSVIELFYSGELVLGVTEKYKLKELNYNKNSYSSKKVDEKVSMEESPAINIMYMIIHRAISEKASDIHLEPLEESVRVRIRIDGVLCEVFKIPKEIYKSINSIIKLNALMDISQKLNPQDGKFLFDYEGQDYNLRVSSIPTINGEKIVLRILYNNSIVKLDALGFSNSTEDTIKELLNKSRGIILITGPTGSGKTTTLHAMIEQMDKEHKNIVSIEEPTEYKIADISQININNKSGMTFEKGLRSILRQDPDNLIIGEIRDEETAEIAIRAAITGHLVLSTLHTYDSISSILRLVDMKIPKYLVSDAISAIISQRLVRKICPHCKTKLKPDEVQREELKFHSGEMMFVGVGCSNCGNSGYKGRTIVYEILKVEEKLRKLINSNEDMELLRKVCKEIGMETLRDNCIALVRSGETTYDEFLRATY